MEPLEDRRVLTALVLSESTASVTEAGGTDTFTVKLDQQPSSNVVLNISSGDTGEVTAAPATLTFTNANWNTAQTVTLTGVDDTTVDGTQTSTITISVDDDLSDNAFDSVADSTVTVTTADNEAQTADPGFFIDNTGGSTIVSETGTTDTFTVVLTKQPAVGSSVVLNVASSDASEATVAPTMLTFTPTNWNVPQVVTVTGVDDALQDGSQTSTITVSVNAASTTDNTFDTVANQTVTVSTLDDEAQAPGTAALVPDPDNPGSFILMVTGTSRNDTIRIRMNDAGEIVVRINGQREGVFQSTDVSGIQVSGRGGNDTINVSSNVTVPAELDGGAGNDNLNGGGGDDLITGGAGNDALTGGPGDDLLRGGQGNDRLFGNSGDDILLGGGGNDHLFGNGGRDMLIGDAGNDKLSGDAGQDILIGGATSFDDNDTALQTLLDEWTSDRTFDERVQNLQMGTGPILSGTGFSLSQGTTVLDNRAHDKLDGGAGQDLIFLSSRKGGKGGDDDDSDEVIPSANVQPNGSGNQGNDHSGGSANSHAKNNGNGNGHAKNKGKGKNKD